MDFAECRFYWFKAFRPGHAVFARKRIFATSRMEALAKIDDWCYSKGYIDFELED